MRSMSIKTPRLIQDRCGVFYFRFLVPQSWRQIVGKTELRRSLRTKDAQQARLSALRLSVELEELMATLKKNTPVDLSSKAGLDEHVRARDETIKGWLAESSANKVIARQFRDGVIHTEIEADTTAT